MPVLSLALFQSRVEAERQINTVLITFYFYKFSNELETETPMWNLYSTMKNVYNHQKRGTKDVRDDTVTSAGGGFARGQRIKMDFPREGKDDQGLRG